MCVACCHRLCVWSAAIEPALPALGLGQQAIEPFDKIQVFDEVGHVRGRAYRAT